MTVKIVYESLRSKQSPAAENLVKSNDIATEFEWEFGRTLIVRVNASCVSWGFDVKLSVGALDLRDTRLLPDPPSDQSIVLHDKYAQFIS